MLFEGGNVAKGPNNAISDTEDLKLLSTYHKPQEAQFAGFDATSAACAQAAWMAAKLHAAYPEAWPETIRAEVFSLCEWVLPRSRERPSRCGTRRRYANLGN